MTRTFTHSLHSHISSQCRFYTTTFDVDIYSSEDDDCRVLPSAFKTNFVDRGRALVGDDVHVVSDGVLCDVHAWGN